MAILHMLFREDRSLPGGTQMAWIGRGIVAVGERGGQDAMQRRATGRRALARVVPPPADPAGIEGLRKVVDRRAAGRGVPSGSRRR